MLKRWKRLRAVEGEGSSTIRTFPLCRFVRVDATRSYSDDLCSIQTLPILAIGLISNPSGNSINW